MFWRLRNLFRKRRGEDEFAEPHPDAPPSQEFGPPQGSRSPGESSGAAGAEESAPPGGSDSLKISLKPILLTLPDPLKARVRQPPAGGAHISVPTQKILAQLAYGSVRITFGELRQAAPDGVFVDSSDQDQATVDLPLHDILSQLKPDQLQRRPQKKVEVPEDVTPLFGARGEPLTQLRMITTSKAPGAPQSPAPAAPAPAPRPTFAPPPAFVPGVARPPAQPAFTPRPLPTAPAPALPSKPAAPPPSPAPIRTTPTLPSPALRPTTPPATGQPIRPSHPLPGAPVKVTPAPVARPLAAPAPAPAAAPSEPLVVPVGRLIASWPEPIRQALSATPEAVAALPSDEIEQALKRGKIILPWNRLRSFIKPPPSPSTAAEMDDTELEVPLAVIAPLFLARRRPMAAQKKYTITEDIPDVFRGRALAPTVTTAPVAQAPAAPAAPAPVAPAPAIAAPASPSVRPPAAPTPRPTIAPTPRPLAAPAPRPPAAPAPRPPAAPAPRPVVAPVPAAAPPAATPAPEEIGEVFGQPGRTNWTPMEIVQRTSILPGVAGALIAMQDGLMVASHLPPGLNAETIAAFIPQMFSRVMQYCEELKFGEANSFVFIVENVPLKIFKVGSVYFTVLGRDGEPLPEPHLSIVAAELGPQGK